MKTRSNKGAAVSTVSKTKDFFLFFFNCRMKKEKKEKTNERETTNELVRSVFVE